MLRADVVVLETASLVLREHDDPASAVGKAFEHASPHCAGQALRRARRTPVPVDWLQTTKTAGDVRALSPSAQGRGAETSVRGMGRRWARARRGSRCGAGPGHGVSVGPGARPGQVRHAGLRQASPGPHWASHSDSGGFGVIRSLVTACRRRVRSLVLQFPRRTRPRRGTNYRQAIGRYLWELHPKVACNSPTPDFIDASKRWNCNGCISTLERLTWELHATLWGNYTMGPHPQSKQLAPQETTSPTRNAACDCAQQCTS